MEDAESIYGAPKDRYETDTSVQFTYEYGLYQTITLGFDNETGNSVFPSICRTYDHG